MNQLLDTACPSTSAEPVFAPMSPPSPAIACAAVPSVAVSRIICFSWADVLADPAKCFEGVGGAGHV